MGREGGSFEIPDGGSLLIRAVTAIHREELPMSAEFAVRLAGIFLGVLSRSLVPWLRKLRDGETRKFSRRYFVSMLASLIFCFIVTLAIFPDLNIPAGPAASGATPFEMIFRLFCVAFGFGFGFNAILLEGEQWLDTDKKRAARKAADKGRSSGTGDIQAA